MLLDAAQALKAARGGGAARAGIGTLPQKSAQPNAAARPLVSQHRPQDSSAAPADASAAPVDRHALEP